MILLLAWKPSVMGLQEEAPLIIPTFNTIHAWILTHNYETPTPVTPSLRKEANNHNPQFEFKSKCIKIHCSESHMPVMFDNPMFSSIPAPNISFV